MFYVGITALVLALALAGASVQLAACGSPMSLPGDDVPAADTPPPAGPSLPFSPVV